MEYQIVNLGRINDPMVLTVLKNICPDLIKSIPSLWSWSYRESDLVVISLAYASISFGHTLSEEESKLFREKLTELKRNQKIEHIENEGLD